ncbi:hypothetical protein KXJ74_07340 [Acinetobacter johnsonii]|nr:hypothetical protein KXJ74_07340 [Acinetobacter johnsonii]
MQNKFIRIQANIMANRNTEEKGFDITLSVRGVLISGTITTKDEFYAAPQNSHLKRMLDYSNKMFGEVRDEDMFSEEPSLYLKDATYLTGNQMIPSSNGIYISVDLDSIDAFNIGKIE